MPKKKNTPGFTDEVREKLELALTLAEHRVFAADRYMARGGRLSSLAKAASERGELERESPEGEAIATELNFYRNEVIGESFMAAATTMIYLVASEWSITGEPPDSLADALYQQAQGVPETPFADADQRTITLSTIALQTIETTAIVMEVDSTVLNERMPAVLAEAAIQVARGITGVSESENFICSDCQEEGARNHPGIAAEIQTLKLGPEGIKEVSPEDLREIYQRTGTFGPNAKNKEDKKPKKKP